MSAELKLSINRPLKSLFGCTTGISFYACSLRQHTKWLYTAAHTTKTATASSSPCFTYYIKITLH